ncbi:uncharacterized protein DUF4174 [Kushneria sinocarnis]|uniref:Uncharacterized protein DUF4174 n=1 Tax=Kushneria sinocarnis TaxID=595502 RepID=A0A420WWF3_9GAMM|nr:DUF4174 domain-containing protein [Kushneria sinocarnis]RKR03446.1 uncharacterized protein DUF4174 [Kushneria sinocarnis]
MKHWLLCAMMAAGIGVAGGASAADPANPLVGDRWTFRPLIIVTPSVDNPDYQRMRGILASHHKAFEDRDMLLYTVENGEGERAGQPMTDAETTALLNALELDPHGELTTVLVGKDGGRKVQQTGPVDPMTIFDTIDRMPMRQAGD